MRKRKSNILCMLLVCTTFASCGYSNRADGAEETPSQQRVITTQLLEKE